MAFCEKCGAMIADDIKFCDKCGAPTNYFKPASEVPVYESAKPIEPDEIAAPMSSSESSFSSSSPSAPPVSPYPAYAYAPVPAKKSLFEIISGFLPGQYTTPGDKTMHWIGLSSLATLAVTYIVCMFVFMADMCMPISLTADFGIKELAMRSAYVDSATPFWMIVYMFLNILPACFAIMALKKPKYKFYSICLAVVLLVISVIALISYGSIDTIKVVDEGSPDKLAWYVLCDCLSEVWYLKLILPLGVILGFGVDNFVNKAK